MLQRAPKNEFITPTETGSLEDEVSSLVVKTDGSYARVPEYQTFDRNGVLSHMESVASAVKDVMGSGTYAGLDEARAATIDFVTHAFDVYEGKVEADRKDWVFAVPARTARSQSNEYATEITPFLPLLDPKFGVNADIRQRSVVGLSPTVIENYEGTEQTKGAIVYTPLYEDMRYDYSHASDRLRVSQNNIQRTAEFARRRLGASVMGLGAVLPSLTHYGRDITEEGLTVTTGHGGTVHLITETVSSLAEKVTRPPHIGVIGAAGSIGKSSLDAIIDNGEAAGYAVSDVNQVRLAKIIEGHPNANAISIGTNGDVLRKSDIIVAAITTPIDLDSEEYEGLDLTGKIIVDDSQPGSFSREQVEARGGKLVWVVGNDVSESGHLTRVGGYKFGDAAGLYSENSVWGCEAEAASISIENRHDLAIAGPVTPDQATSIGGLIRAIGVVSPRVFESYARPVQF